MLMKEILIAWELGGGLGHLIPMRTLVTELLDRGHGVTLAVRDLVAAGKAFGDLPVKFFQAPHRIEPFRSTFDPPSTYGHILNNIGFGSAEGLQALAAAWQSIFASVDPSLALFDHSPTAIFAARGMEFRKGQIGTGFTIPPKPFPLVRPWVNHIEASWEEDDRRTLQLANQAAARLGMRPLDSLEEIYASTDKTFLATYPELDHFGPRPDASYGGVEFIEEGAHPQWPAGDGPKIFAYLSRFRGFEEALSQIGKLRLPAIVFSPSLLPGEILQFGHAFPSVTFTSTPLNLERVVHECQVAVCHGSHGLISRMLLAGIPCVAMPLHLEQALLCQRLVQFGGGIHLPKENVGQLGVAISYVNSENSLRAAAMRFRSTYSSSASNVCQQVLHWIHSPGAKASGQ